MAASGETSGSSSSTDTAISTESRDMLAKGLLELLKPAVVEVDGHVTAVRQSQVELRHQIDSLAEDLRSISEQQDTPLELDGYIKKLNNSKRRVMIVNNILQNAQDRLIKLQQNIEKDIAKKQAASSKT